MPPAPGGVVILGVFPGFRSPLIGHLSAVFVRGQRDKIRVANGNGRTAAVVDCW
jgi:hypothetical protein